MSVHSLTQVAGLVQPVSPPEQVMPAPQEQAPFWQVCSVRQVRPQKPQSLGLVEVSTQTPLHTDWPVGQTVTVQVPDSHA